DDFARNGTHVTLSGREILTLSAEDTLVALCIHGAKDFWARLIWIADISELIQSHPELEWDRVLRRAETLRAQRMVSLGLYLAVLLLGARISASARLTHPEKDVRRLAEHFAQQLLARQVQSWSALERFAFRRRCVPGFISGW